MIWKTQVNGVKSSWFPKILSPKLFGNWWLYVQFLMIFSCFTFPLLHGYGFSRKLSEQSINHYSVRDRTLSLYEEMGGGGGGGGGREFLLGEVMKYFRHILMGHEIFLKVFDGTQNISLRSIFIILFLKLRGWSTKYPN